MSNLWHDIDRLVVRGTIHLPVGFHLGSGEASRRTDAAIRRDATGQPYIPGSSLTGCLRNWYRQFAPYFLSNHEKLEDELFGCASDLAQTGKPGQASRLFVEDAFILNPLPAAVEVRDHVGLDRRRAAARANILFDNEVVPANTHYQFEISIVEPKKDEVGMLLALLDLWCRLGFRLGAKTTSGLGEAYLLEDSLRYFAVRLSNHKMFLSYLLDGEVSTPYEYLPDNWQVTRAELDDWVKGFGVVYRLHNRRAKPEYLLGQRLFLTLDLIPEEPLLLQAPVAAIPETDTNVGKDRVSDADFVTALVYDPECDQIIEKQYVPGSSLHGVLRSRAEKIVRTLNFYRDVDPARLDDHFQDFERAYYERICACAVTHMVKEKFPDQDGESDEKRMAREQWPEEGERARLLACFGTPQKQQNAQAVMAELTTLGDTRHAEELYEKSCVACRMFGNSMMRGRLLVSDATLLPSRASAKLFDHVAIDRFHGGAADQKKFDSRPLMPRPDANHPSVFAPLFRCTIALERFEPWMLGLLGHLLKDLAEGDIRLGHATRRGYGRVRSVVSAAELYVLPGSELHRLCLYTGLLPKSLQERSLLPPFWQISLNLATLFASETWNENTATSAPEAIFLSACDAALQELVEEEEGQPHGSF